MTSVQTNSNTSSLDAKDERQCSVEGDVENPTANASASSYNGDNEVNVGSLDRKEAHQGQEAIRYAIHLQPVGCMCRLVSLIFLGLVVFFGGVVGGYYYNLGWHTSASTEFALMALGLTILYSCIWFGFFWAVQRKKSGSGAVKFYLSTLLLGILSMAIFLMGFYIILQGVVNGYDACYERPGGDHGACMETVSVGIILVIFSHIFFGGGVLIARSCDLKRE